MNKLIVNANNTLKCLESLPSNHYNLILLEPPFNTGFDDYVISLDKNKNDKDYGEYISHLVERTYNLLRNDGFLCFSIISKMSSNYNYQMILEHFFKSIIPITLKNKRASAFEESSHLIVYCCSKNDIFDFSKLRTLDDVSNYTEIDSNGRHFQKLPAKVFSPYERPALKYIWHGIETKNKESWRYSEEKMNQEYENGNVIIEDNTAFIKKYHDESFVKIPTVWENNNSYSSISEKNTMLLLNLFSLQGQNVLCPYERDGMFSVCADKSNRIWTSFIFPSEHKNLIDQIPTDNYQQVIIEESEHEVQYETVTKSSNEVNELRNKLEYLQDAIKMIQTKIGVNSDDENSIDLIIDTIHEKITDTLSEQTISSSIPDVQNWMTPNWNRLENESKRFLPTGAFLFKQLEKQEGADYAPAMIEYCRTLEKEMFEKLFVGYIQNVIDRNINIDRTFPDSISNKDSSVFTKFVKECVNRYPTLREKWHFELGKMAFVLTRVLARNQSLSIFKDFREFLNNAFDTQFFGERFSDQLSYIVRLRNNCAHPSLVNQEAVLEGREIIRKKLNSILAYYI